MQHERRDAVRGTALRDVQQVTVADREPVGAPRRWIGVQHRPMVANGPARRFMKICRRDSWWWGCGRAAPSGTMGHGMRSFPRRHPAPRHQTHERRHAMQWTTPTATDFRFGFEITMYVAAR
jgi:coenzyme PQQ precursor peptide PqqA